MNKSLYVLGVFFLTITVLCGIFQSILHFRLDNQMFILESFNSWFLASSVVWLIAAFILLKYYHFKQYRFAFRTATAHAVLSFFQVVVLYAVLTARLLQN